jgi:NhaP-type Na+/H+ and K+/H+ antiporter
VRKRHAARLPGPVATVLERSGGPNASTLATYGLLVGRSVLGAIAAFVLASILLLYLLIEAAQGRSSAASWARCLRCRSRQHIRRSRS